MVLVLLMSVNEPDRSRIAVAVPPTPPVPLRLAVMDRLLAMLVTDAPSSIRMPVTKHRPRGPDGDGPDHGRGQGGIDLGGPAADETVVDDSGTLAPAPI